MDIPLFSGSLLQNQCQGKWRLNLEKASKSLTVIVVNSSPGAGSFIYCKSLHLPELLTSKSFYCRPLGASLMCVSVCFNINIPHMCSNLYKKPWKGRLHAQFGRFWVQRYVVNLNERELMCDDMNVLLKIIFSFQMCNHPNLPLRFTNPCATFSCITKLKESADQTETGCRWRIKGGTRFFFFFRAPSARLSEHLLKCPLKQWFVGSTKDATMSSGHLVLVTHKMSLCAPAEHCVSTLNRFKKHM